MTALRFGPLDPADPEAGRLIAAHQSASRAHYEVEDCHAFDPAQMVESGTQLFGAWRGGTLLAIGGLRPVGRGQVELKSMFTDPATRGQGVARALLEHLIAEAQGQGHREMVLEAGRSDAYAAPARALYARAGFAECPPFGSYTARPASIYMARGL